MEESRYLRVGKYNVYCNGENLGYVTAYNKNDALKIAVYKFGLGREGNTFDLKLINFTK